SKYDFVSEPAIGSGGTIFVSTLAGLVAIDPNDGKRKWSVAGVTGGTIAIGANGAIYLNDNGVINAVGPATPPPSTSISVPPALPFGSEKVGGRKIEKLKIENHGGAPLIIAGVTASDSTQFRPGASDCPAAGLPPHEKCTIAVTFVPAKTGAIAATLSLHDNADKGKQTVALSGTGGS
ncbi:MAG: choice-of-anchor D domain-containing protein, partial [Candidatus Binataceae bacterium]